MRSAFRTFVRLGSLAALVLFTAPALAERWVLTGVHVVPMDRERVLQNRDVLVAGRRIEAVAPAGTLALDDGVRRVDGGGGWLMPGLYEMHAHVPGDADSTDRVLTLFLVNGVTTVRGMLGAPQHLALREALAEGRRLGPRLITSGPSFNGRSVTSPAQAAQRVREQAAAGYDFLKIHPGLTREQFDALVEAARDADIPFAGHVSAEVGLARALEAGQDSIDHLDAYFPALVADGADLTGREPGFFGMALADVIDEDKIAPLARRTAAAGVWNVPTQTLIENLASTVPGATMAAQPAMRYMPAATVARWQEVKDSVLNGPDYDADKAALGVRLRRALILALHEAGAGLLLGSDAPQIFNVPGFATHEELALMVASGLTPYEALATGTVNPARYFGEDGKRGRIAPGYAADLVLLGANPLEDIANVTRIEGVVRQGRWLSRERLDTMLGRFERSE